jgi:hypothetical protein
MFLCRKIESHIRSLGQDNMGEDIITVNRPNLLILLILTTEAHN